MYWITIVLAILGVLLFLLYRHRVRQTNVFRSLGIPGPEPHWLTGTQTEFDQKSGFESLQSWSSKYGKMYGYYEGPLPILVTSDPEMIKEVFVKQFSKFHGRKRFAISPDPVHGEDVNMINVYGNRWKRLRTIINPTFSASKLKQIKPLLKEKVDILIDKLGKYADKGETVDIQKDFQALTIDVIGEVAFGMEMDAQRNPEEKFLINVKKAFDMNSTGKRPFIVYVATLFPEIQDFLYKIVIYLVAKLDQWPFFWLQEQLEKVTELRRKQSVGRKDLLQLMLDAEASDDDDLKNIHMWESKEQDEGAKMEKKKLTNLEIINQGVLFLLAGYDTTSNLLSYMANLLAVYPEKQTKLQEEIDDYMKDNDIEDIERLQKLPYLDMVINESLRLYPVGASIVNRLCMEASTVQGIHIPAGMVIQADSMTVHHDPELWGPTDPKLFEPERFSEEAKASRHPMAWIPFGVGPRNCVGMRLGLMESKLTLAKLLARYTFCRCEQTVYPLEVYEAATITPKNGVYIRLAHRK